MVVKNSQGHKKCVPDVNITHKTFKIETSVKFLLKKQINLVRWKFVRLIIHVFRLIQVWV